MPPATLTLYAKFEADDVVDTFLADVLALASATFTMCTVTCAHEQLASHHTVTFTCAVQQVDDACFDDTIDEYKALVPSIVEAALQAVPTTAPFDKLVTLTRCACGAFTCGCSANTK
jgi:hypothetical protein